MSRRMQRNLMVVFLILIGLALSPLQDAGASPWLMSYGQSRWGVIAAKGRVLGPNGKPIWAEYNSDGEVVREIGEAHEEPLENATVISGHAYRSYVSAYEAIEAQYQDQAQVYSREAYETNTFSGPDNQPLAKPPLNAATRSVVVRDPQTVYGNMNLVLHESILDLQRVEHLSDSIRSVLLAKEGFVIDTSTTNIGYRTAYYTPKESTIHDVENGWVKGRDDMVGVDPDVDQLWGPIAGAEISEGVETTFSDQEGRFRAYRIGNCDVLTFASTKLRYNIFDPQDKFPGHYRMTYEWQPDCWWVPECMPGAGPPPVSPSLAGMMAYIAWQNQCMMVAPNGLGYAPLSILKHNYTAKIKFHIDVVMVSGQIRIANPPGVADVIKGDATTYAYVAPLFTPTDPGAQSLRLPDTPADFGHQGLVGTISEEDLKDTDLYIFRMSNDQLIMAREGLADDETLPYFVGGIEQYQDLIQFNLLMRGPQSDRDDNVRRMRASRDIWLFENHQKATGVNPELWGRKADHLRIGEKVKVVAVNRATGYIGTGIGTYGSPAGYPGDGQADTQSQGVVQMYVSPIYMRPPNIKIKAERRFTVKAGLTKDQTYANMIGFEGSGLTSDNFVAISTEWYDHDGTPLPGELPGYTGRLSKVVGVNRLAAAGGQVANFEIKPGKHLQLVHLPQEQIDNDHYYIHVSGEPVKGNPNFSDTGAAADGPLQYRPAHYAPVMVPLFDEAATNIRKAAYEAAIEAGVAGLARPEPAYQWYYRPEMQFSLFDLTFDQLEIEHEDESGNSFIEIIPIGNEIDNLALMLEDDVTFAELFYGLDISEYGALPYFGPDKQMVFALGDQELEAQVRSDGSVCFDNFDDFNLLESEDYLALRLYQNGDDANLLWEYAISGLKVTSSSNEGSRQNGSFLIRANESAITVELLADPSLINTLAWEVEALEKKYEADDQPGESNNGSGPGNQPYSYGKTKAWKIGKIVPTTNAQSSGTGTGRYSTPWQSVAYSGDEAMVFSFEPDMSDEPHTPASYRQGNPASLNGTYMTDVWRHNPRVGYKVTAAVNGKRLHSTIIRMDQIDTLRQEFINHNASASGANIPIPERDEFRHVSTLPEGEWGSSNDTYEYAYDYILDNDGTLFRMWNVISTRYATARQNQFYEHTVPNNAIQVTSAFRNPERNERVEGSARSWHMRGRALDVGFPDVDKPSEEIGILLGCLWEDIEDGGGNATGAEDWILERGATVTVEEGVIPTEDEDDNGIPDDYENSDHLHIEDEN